MPPKPPKTLCSGGAGRTKFIFAVCMSVVLTAALIELVVHTRSMLWDTGHFLGSGLGDLAYRPSATQASSNSQATTSCQFRTHWIPVETRKDGAYQPYYKSGGNVYWTNGSSITTRLDSADLHSFVVEAAESGIPVAKDSNGVYLNANRLPNVDPESFHWLCTQSDQFSCYAEDARQVLFFCAADAPYWVEGADAPTFMATDTAEGCQSNCFDAFDANQKYEEGAALK